MAIANGTVSYMPNKTLSKFEHDLDALPLFFAEKQDYVLVHNLPDEKFLELLKNAGIALPNFELLSAALSQNDFIHMPKHSLHPWGWSPRIHHIFKPFKESCSAEFLQQPNAFWKDEHRQLYTRKKAMEVLNIALESSDASLFISKDKAAHMCSSVSEVEQLIEKWKQIVIKTPLSSAGRGIQILRYSSLNQSIIQSINGIIASQGYVMVEAFLNKKCDFSLQYYCDGKGKLDYLGLGYFHTDPKGQYLSNYLGAMPQNIKELLSPKDIEKLQSCMTKILASSDISTEYTGYFGVDCMLVLDEKEEVKIQACVEINLRYNMSTLALFLNQHIHPNTTGEFKIFHKAKTSFDQFHEEMSQKYPLEMQEGKWRNGYLPLVSPFQNKTFGAYILLNKQ
jgi:hypothetical protein